MACLAIEEQPKLAIKMLNNTSHYVAKEYNHRNQRNNLNNNRQEKDKRYIKPVGEKQLRETKTCYECGSKKTSNKIMPKEHQPICHIRVEMFLRRV